MSKFPLVHALRHPFIPLAGVQVIYVGTAAFRVAAHLYFIRRLLQILEEK